MLGGKRTKSNSAPLPGVRCTHSGIWQPKLRPKRPIGKSDAKGRLRAADDPKNGPPQMGMVTRPKPGIRILRAQLDRCLCSKCLRRPKPTLGRRRARRESKAELPDGSGSGDERRRAKGRGESSSKTTVILDHGGLLRRRAGAAYTADRHTHCARDIDIRFRRPVVHHRTSGAPLTVREILMVEIVRPSPGNAQLSPV